MRFKRPQVRYADTPQPATPYQAAAQVWDERIGSARVQAKNWRLMAFGCLLLALLMAGGLVWRSAQSIVTPYVVEVDQAGQVRAVGEAATPYQSAAQVWDERIGSARVQAKNWRFMAFGCLTLAVLMAGGLVWRSAQSIVTPYVIEVDNAGQVRAVGEAATPYRPSDAQMAYHLGRFIGLVRSLSIDPIVVRQNWLDAYDYTTDKGAVVLNEYARAADPFSRIGKESVTVQVSSVTRASDQSFNVRWTETRFVNGALDRTERWNAVISTVLQTPRTEQRVRKNPLGIYVNGLSWSRELEANEGAKP